MTKERIIQLIKAYQGVLHSRHDYWADSSNRQFLDDKNINKAIGREQGYAGAIEAFDRYLAEILEEAGK